MITSITTDYSDGLRDLTKETALADFIHYVTKVSTFYKTHPKLQLKQNNFSTVFADPSKLLETPSRFWQYSFFPRLSNTVTHVLSLFKNCSSLNKLAGN